MIPYGKQSINDDDIAAVVASLRGDFLTTGPLVEQFEIELEKIVGAPCVSVSSGTAALHCAYAAIDLQPGDEIITPPITFIATQATAAMFGAKIVFVDVFSETGLINPNLVEEAITSRTRAIVAVDYAGVPADLDSLRKIADKHNLYLIEDAAHSFGSIYKGKPVGSIADLTTFSFFPTKNATTGEGGAVASTNPVLLQRAKEFSRQGLVRDSTRFQWPHEGLWHQEVHRFGLNYRLPDILCALGISQVRRIGEFKKKRQEIFSVYTSNLGGINELILPQNPTSSDVMWHLFAIQVPASLRKSIFIELRNRKIGVQVNYLPAHKHPVFRNSRMDIGDMSESELFYSREISLPMHVSLEKNEINYISRCLISILESYR